MSKNAEARATRPFPWKCGNCREREVFPSEGEYTTEVVHDGRSYVVTLPDLRAPRCRSCGEIILDTDANRQISQAFRRQAQLLAPEEIRQKRKALGLTQEQLAATLGVAEATLCRWETGAQIQQRSLDKLLRLFFDLPEVRVALMVPGTMPVHPG
jgi:putative zinc finger/helix-turn-helix YgiT family protein